MVEAEPSQLFAANMQMVQPQFEVTPVNQARFDKLSCMLSGASATLLEEVRFIERDHTQRQSTGATVERSMHLFSSRAHPPQSATSRPLRVVLLPSRSLSLGDPSQHHQDYRLLLRCWSS